MTIWILTASEHHYPCSGVYDWKGIYNDEDAAKAAFDKYVSEATLDYESVYLVEIDPDVPQYRVAETTP